MPAGSGGGIDYLIIRSLEDFLKEAGIRISTAQAYRMYVGLKEQFQNAGFDILTDGKISREFVTAAVNAAREGDFRVTQSYISTTSDNNTPSELSGGLGAGAGSATGTDEFAPPDLTDTESKKDYRINARAGFRSILQLYGIGETGNIGQLISEATRHQYNQTTFLYYLRQTPEYRNRFVGIFDEDGSLKMSEAQYLANERQYEDIGSRYGLSVGSRLMGWMFSNNVSPSEFSDRAPAIRMLKSNPALYQQFGKALIQAGVAKPGDVTKPELMKFVLGEGNPEWYKVWNLTRARYVATQTGFTLSRNAEGYFALNPRWIERIANKGLSDTALAEGFGIMEEVARTILPTVEAGLYGVSKRDALKAAFGGKGAIQSRQQIERAQETAEAFGAERAAPTAAVDSTGNFGIYGAGLQRRKAR